MSSPTATQAPSNQQVKTIHSKVRGVVTYELPYIEDARGNLTVGEFGRPLPFVPQRYFITFAIPSGTQRGEHAHYECAQFFICVHGSCTVLVDDGVRQEEFLLDRPTLGLYLPPMVWATESNHTHDAKLMVFASHHYDTADYIRDYVEFQALAAAR
jgi:dTDP-4-dehydrorhamnose 3,5-epimerase-like enzyme